MASGCHKCRIVGKLGLKCCHFECQFCNCFQFAVASQIFLDPLETKQEAQLFCHCCWDGVLKLLQCFCLFWGSLLKSCNCLFVFFLLLLAGWKLTYSASGCGEKGLHWDALSSPHLHNTCSQLLFWGFIGKHDLGPNRIFVFLKTGSRKYIRLKTQEQFGAKNVYAMVNWSPFSDRLFSHSVKLLQHRDKG